MVSTSMIMLCGLVIAVDLILILNHVRRIGVGGHSRTEEYYTYQGHDFPETLPLPMDEIPSKIYQMQESEEYPVEGLNSDHQWFSLTSSSVGYVRLGESKRIFMVTMFHELHCLRVLNLAFEPNGSPMSRGHIKHCIDYLRQMALCSADLTLERGDFAMRDFATERVGATHTCRDWTVVYDVMEQNWREWVSYTNGKKYQDS